MSFRRISFAASALILALAAGPIAQAGTLGSSTSNSVSATNVAAGIGNRATQNIFAQQTGQLPMTRMGTGGWGVPTLGLGGGTNSITGTNVAAGLNNSASQSIGASQLGGSPWSGLGANSVTGTNVAAGIGNKAVQGIGAQQGPGGFNSVDATNVAAGIGNFAGQQIMTSQR